MSKEVDWPIALERTEPHKRKPCPNGFRVSRDRAFRNILKELDRWDGVTDVQLEFGANALKTNPNKPYANATFDDPSVVVRFSKDGEDMAGGCDKWDNPRDNAQDLYHYLHETRMQEQRGTVTAESEYRKLRLPAAGEAADPPPHIVLGVDPDASEGEVREAYRERAKETHADLGGSDEEFKRVKRAKEELLS